MRLSGFCYFFPPLASEGQTVNLSIVSSTMVLSVGISAPGFSSQPYINVRIINKAEAPAEVITHAQRIMSKIFSVARIQIRWQECPVPGNQASQHPECGDGPAVIGVVINDDASSPWTRKALGVSLPSIGAGNRAGVFYSRIEKAAYERTVSLGASVAEVLAYVMAHEIGHLLLNSKMHSNEGIMRADWTFVEFGAMRNGKLSFPAAEAGAMRRAVVKRNHLPENRDIANSSSQFTLSPSARGRPD
jgi:hypothetical protein